MTFSIILAYVVFGLTSFWLLIAGYNVVRTKTPLEVALGYSINLTQILIAFVIWAACGVYLWG